MTSSFNFLCSNLTCNLITGLSKITIFIIFTLNFDDFVFRILILIISLFGCLYFLPRAIVIKEIFSLLGSFSRLSNEIRLNRTPIKAYSRKTQ